MQDTELPRSVELLMLTGFLGSGKTTLLSSFLRLPRAEGVAVIVNEIGEIDLDGALLNATAAKVPMALLSNGCVCCAMGSDLAGTIAMLIEERAAQGQPLGRIILETTGVALPGPILRGLGPLAGHLRAHIVSTFDLEHGLETLDLPEAAAQIAAAQRVVLTKSDRHGAMNVDDAMALIAQLNPLADVVTASDSTSLSERALAPLNGPSQSLALLARTVSEAIASGQCAEAEHSRIRTYLARVSEPVACDALCEWLDNLAGAAGARLLRLKGLVHVTGMDRPMLVQCVGTVFSPIVPAAIEASDSFLVIITRDMSRDELLQVPPALPLVLTRTLKSETALGRKLSTVLNETLS